jgi:SAM-dependent methyltransferase
MASGRVSGTEGYAEEAEALIEQYEKLRFADVHRAVLQLTPTTPGRVLDIGSGTGRDAAAFAAMGHAVVAVGPTAELRTRAAGLHPSPRIEWLDDGLPNLTLLTRRGESFDVVMLTAVWMHLDQQQRQQAMPRVASLVRRGGVMIFTLRRGPVPVGRRMFGVSAEETIHLAEAEGLSLALKLENQPGSFGRTDVSWTRLAFSKLGKAV